MGDTIDELIEETLLDAYGESEQLWSFRQAFEVDVRYPLRGEGVGVEVEVEVDAVDFAGDERRGPFLRCLHGLALCAWRQRRWDDAEAMFTARVWLDPSGPLDALACLQPVRARQRWTRS